MKNIAVVAVLITLLAFAGCSAEKTLYRTVQVVIPLHPWEQDKASMWYDLVWNEGTGRKSVFVDNSTRTVSLRIPKSQTTYICAYPLGSLKPFGGAITPLSQGNVFVLDQDKGVFAELLQTLEHPSALHINFEKLVENAALLLEDYSLLDTETLIEDVYNGTLGKTSVVRTEPVKVTGLEFYSGTWIPENVHSEAFYVDIDGKIPVLYLPQGVHRFICHERELEIRIVVSSDGVYKYERPSEMV